MSDYFQNLFHLFFSVEVVCPHPLQSVPVMAKKQGFFAIHVIGESVMNALSIIVEITTSPRRRDPSKKNERR